MSEVQRFIAQLEETRAEFTPIPFWFFNDEPNEEKIRAQLADYVEKGVNGIVLHPRIGVPEEVPYLSEAYFKAVRFIVKTADELDMKIVLYDEGMYPSGSAHGMVAAQNPEFASKGILLAKEPGENEVIARLEDGGYLVYGFTGGTIRGIHFGEDDLESGAPKSADILNPEAVDLFIRLTHERYYEELKEYFGSTVIAFFTDEPCALGRNAGAFKEWVPGMEEEIRAQGGSLEELRGLFCGQQNKTTEIYHRLIKKHLREIFYARLSGWCEAHGIALMGHPEASDDVEEELFFHIPGQDLIMRRVAPESGGVREFDSVQAKLSADIARHLGRRRNANECFGVCNHFNLPWYFKGYDMKWYLNWLGIRGVNLFVPHAFYYSVAGKRKEERPPDVGPNNIWWPHYRQFSEYIKRISWLMTDSASFARVAVLCDNNRVPYEEIAGLYENQIDFHYLPLTMLDQCRAEEGRLCIRDSVFDVVLDVYGEWDSAAAEKGLQDVRAVRRAEELYTGGSLGAEDHCATVRVTPACAGIRAVHMAKDGVEWYLLSNETGAEQRAQIVFPAFSTDGQKQRILCVDLWKNKVRSCAAENGAVNVRLQPCEMLLFLQAEDKEAAEILRAHGAGSRQEHGTGFQQTETDLGDWTDRFILSETGDNTAVYTYTYEISQVDRGAFFTVAGEEMAECDCNGQHVGASFYGPHTFRIGEFLKAGSNRIKVRFTGNAVNLYGEIRVPFGLGVREQPTIMVNTVTEAHNVELSWERPDDMPGNALFQVLLNGKSVGECDENHFVLEGLRSAAYYDAQVRVLAGNDILRCSEVLHLHTKKEKETIF